MTSLAPLTHVTGTATVRGRGDRPAGGVLTVKLVNKDFEVLAATAVEDDGDALPFDLVVDAVLAPELRDLRLWAMLRTEAGVWGTPDVVTLREDLVLSRVDG